MADQSTEPRQNDELRSKWRQGSVDSSNARARPKSRLGSYLTTHRYALTTEKPDAQPFVQSVARMRDNVYKPEPEQMMTTMLTWLLGHPAQGLPPHHNSFLLHVFECYRNLQQDLELMRHRLQEEVHDHQAHIAQFHRTQELWLEHKQTYTAEIDRLRFCLEKGWSTSNLTNTSRISLLAERPAARWQSVETNASDEMEANGHTTKNLGIVIALPQTWSSSTSENRTSSDLGPMHSQGHFLAKEYDEAASFGEATSMGQTCRQASFFEADGIEESISDTARDYSYTEGEEDRWMSQDSGSSSQLGKWLTDRTGEPRPNTPGTVCNVPRKPSQGPTISSRRSSDINPRSSSHPRRHVSNEYVRILAGTSHLTRHQRGFSFRPGDDAKPSSLSNLESQQNSQVNVTKHNTDPSPAIRHLSSISKAGFAVTEEPLSHVDVGFSAQPPKNNFTVTKSPVSSSVLLPQRDDSGRSAITAIRHSSSRSSSASKGDSSHGMYASPRQELTKHLKHNVTAVAAARAVSEDSIRKSRPKLPASTSRRSSQRDDKGQLRAVIHDINTASSLGAGDPDSK